VPLSLGALDASEPSLSRLRFEGPSDLRPTTEYAVRDRFQPLGNGRYRSVDYDTAANRVQMHLELGIGDLVVR